jgi:hypothetical protein
MKARKILEDLMPHPKFEVFFKKQCSYNHKNELKV